MSIVSRYVFRQAGSALALILMSLGGIIWIAMALKQLNIVTAQGQDTLMLLKMTTLALPNLLAIVAPFALFIACIQVLNRLNTDSELIVLTASGATVWSVAKPLLVLGVIVMSIVAFTNHIGMPWSLRQLKIYIVQVRTDLLTQVIQPGRFSNPEADLTFHIRERTVAGELIGLVMHDDRKPNESQSYLAERGQIAKQGDGAYLIMTNGHILRGSGPREPAEIIAFQSYAVDLDQFDKTKGGKTYYKPRESYLGELIEPDPDNGEFKRYPGRFRSELQERFSNPMYCIAFVLIALAAAGQARSTRQNRTERLVFGVLIALGLRMVGLAVNNLVVANAALAPLMYALPLGAIVLSTLILVRGARPQNAANITDVVMAKLQPLFSRLRRGQPPPGSDNSAVAVSKRSGPGGAN